MRDSEISDDGKKVYLRLLSYVKRYTKEFLVGIFAIAVFSATDAIFVSLMKPLLDKSILARDIDWIILIPVLLIVVGIVRAVAGFVSNYCITWVGQRVIKDLRTQLFTHFLNMPSRYFDHTSSATLVSKMIYDVEQVAQASTTALTTMVRDSFSIIYLISLMLWYNWRLSLMFLIMAPVIAFIVTVVAKRFRIISHRIQNSMGNITHVTEEVIDGHRVVKTFGGHALEDRNFEVANERNRQQRMKLQVSKELSDSVLQMLIVLSIAIFIFLATGTSLKEGVTPGIFVSIITALIMLQRPVKRLTSVNSQLQKGIAACQSIFNVLDTEKERDTGTIHVDKVRGDVSFENVNFAYEPEKGNVLKDINLHIEAGKTIALVGHSGSGKSTLASLLPRFYDLQEGVIKIDGVDINDYILADLRKQIALVTQQVTLFNETVENNIAYGDLRHHSTSDVIEAARHAYAYDFINELPQGFQTIVGENGILLSGGQRQRIAIARALLKDAPILILDEATSALDTESERYIQKALDVLMRNRTTLVIAHRLSTIEKADIIVVMEDGRIVETGDHAALLAANGKYAALHSMQFKEEE